MFVCLVVGLARRGLASLWSMFICVALDSAKRGLISSRYMSDFIAPESSQGGEGLINSHRTPPSACVRPGGHVLLCFLSSESSRFLRLPRVLSVGAQRVRVPRYLLTRFPQRCHVWCWLDTRSTSHQRGLLLLATQPRNAPERTNWKKWMEVTKKRRYSQNKCSAICDDNV
jgi:hypothetical protein